MLVYWIKENPNVIVINTNNIIIQYSNAFSWAWIACCLQGLGHSDALSETLCEEVK